VSSHIDSNCQLSELIGRLYDAAIDEALWSGIAARIADAFESTSTVLKLHGDSGSVQLLDTTENLVIADRDRAWADHWHRNDLWVERSVVYGMSRVVTSQDLVSPTEVEQTGFYQEWLRHVEIHHMIGTVFPTEAGGVGVLGIHRPRADGHYSDADRSKAALLVPHIQRAFQISRRLTGVSLVHDAAFGALDRINTGVILLDRSRRIIHANGLAEIFLRDIPEIGVSNGRLTVRDPVMDGQLAALVCGAIETADGQHGHPQTALAVPRDTDPPFTLALAPFRPRWSRLNGQPALALVFMRDPGRICIDPGQLRDLFGLTRAEAATAIDLVRGMSLAEIATAHGVGGETVRSHVKKILAKTGTQRQAEAVALLLRAVGTISDLPCMGDAPVPEV
jgi:DNA-binding CsgD family transcriptional regulator